MNTIKKGPAQSVYPAFIHTIQETLIGASLRMPHTPVCMVHTPHPPGLGRQCICSKWQLHGYLSMHRDFGEYLNKALCDRLVCSLRNKSTQNACCHLTFEDAMDLAQSMEATDRNTKALQGTETAAVNQLTTPHLRNVTSSAYTASQLCYQIENTLELSIH